MCNNSSYCCKNCPENPISYKILLKKKILKKNFSSKKIQKSKLVNFRFQLDWMLGFRVRGKNWKIEKAGRTWPEDCFYLPERGVRCCSLDCHWATEWFKVILLLLNTFSSWVLQIFSTQNHEKIFSHLGWKYL